MAVNFESSDVIYLATNYHTIISKLQDCSLEILETDDLVLLRKKKKNQKKLTLNNCQINSTIPARLISKIGILNVREQLNVNIMNEDVLYYEEVGTNSLNCICSYKFNTLKIYNVNTQGNKFSRKRMINFDGITEIEAKILEISLAGNNYSEIIGNVIEHGVSNNLEIVSDSGVPTVDER